MPKSKVRTADEEVRVLRTSAQESAPRRPKQRPLPGLEWSAHPDVEEAADAYVATRDKYQDWSEREKVAHANLLAAMKGHKLEAYRYDGKLVSVGTSERVKVKSLADNGDE